MAVRQTQSVVEVIGSAAPALRETQSVIEVVQEYRAVLRETQTVVEVFQERVPLQRLTQSVLEVVTAFAEDEEPPPSTEPLPRFVAAASAPAPESAMEGDGFSMMSVIENGVPVYDPVHGLPTWECCCDEVPTCTNLCGCCYSDDAVMAVPAGPLVEFYDEHPDILIDDPVRAAAWAGTGHFIDQINTIWGAGGHSLAFGGGGFFKDLLSSTSGWVDSYGVTWVWTDLNLLVSCDVVDGTTRWLIVLTARIEGDGYYGEELEITGTTAEHGCCGTDTAITWSLVRNIGLTPPSNDIDPVQVSGGQGTLTVSSNKCCVGTLGDCTHTNTENCTDYTDDAECPEEGI